MWKAVHTHTPVHPHARTHTHTHTPKTGPAADEDPRRDGEMHCTDRGFHDTGRVGVGLRETGYHVVG